jgi:hypothetical protein
MGIGTSAGGFAATALGNATTASAGYSTAMGIGTTASGLYSTAMGNGTTASADYSTTLGWNSAASGAVSLATGFNTLAAGNYSTAAGYRTEANSYAGYALGRYNVGGGTPTVWATADPLFEVGNGTSTASRNNAFTILKNGQIGINNATPSYLVHLENPNLSDRSIYLNHDKTLGTANLYSVFVNTDNTAVNAGTTYGGYFDVSNGDGTAYGVYVSSSTSATDSTAVYGVRVFASNTGGTGSAYGIYSSVSGSSTGNKYAGYFAGDVLATGAYLPSDARLKTALHPAPARATDRLGQLTVTEYQYRTTEFPQMALPEGTQTGLIAQDVEKVFPELVKTAVHPATTEEEIANGAEPAEELEFKVVDYARLVPHLVKAVQEQQIELDNLRAELNALKTGKGR